MPIDPVSAVTATPAAVSPPEASSASNLYSAPSTKAPKQVMDGSMFMSLLVAQLQNQDPSSPMDTNQMIGQTTQLAMMEKLSALDTTSNENFSLQMRMAAAALVGQQVSYAGKDGETVTGIASSVSYAGPVPQITVDGKTLALDAISGVTTAAPKTPVPTTAVPTTAVPTT
ncbi:flagellar hook assembly protein FlgD [Arthrobacter sp. H14-L1]|uniref:flagellar hook assembly protein FlgD n=1 Tax=Arthrobacter sp. H14-L1 TaxID=2996697 RepID=UPI00227000B2|nr:flagellar hook capping FlgD N-terminal domain-containing protein [Arthrobacter sp. H14-L1]MCY0903387.1 flagellar hook capping protein [Arthrobacter sp. H14-L1]